MRSRSAHDLNLMSESERRNSPRVTHQPHSRDLTRAQNVSEAHPTVRPNWAPSESYRMTTPLQTLVSSIARLWTRSRASATLAQSRYQSLASVRPQCKSTMTDHPQSCLAKRSANAAKIARRKPRLETLDPSNKNALRPSPRKQRKKRARNVIPMTSVI